MTEKQFSIVGKEYVSYYCGYAQIISNGTLKFRIWERQEDAQKLCDLLNEQQARIEMLEKGILDCLFNNKSIGMFAEEMRLVE